MPVSEADAAKSYVKESVEFFNSYLSLCAKHSVQGYAYLKELEDHEFGVNTEVACQLFRVDGDDAADAFWSIPNIYRKQQLAELQKSYKDYQAATQVLETHIRSFFGCTDLHYVFLDPDEYKFDNSAVRFEYERQIFKNQGKWRATMYVIKKELLEKWPNASVEIREKSIFVKYKE